MSKYISDIKLTIIQGYNPKVISQEGYAKQMGVTKAQFQYWLRLFEVLGKKDYSIPIQTVLLALN